MATLVILKNPLSVTDREVYALRGESVIDILQDRYPDGFSAGGVRFFVNATEMELDDLDYVPTGDDLAVVMVVPREPISTIAAYLIASFISTVVSYLISSLFASTPETPEFADIDDPTPVYGITNRQNSARIGQHVPVVYGRVRFTPDLAAQPYTVFEYNPDLPSNPQYINASVRSDITGRPALDRLKDYGVGIGDASWFNNIAGSVADAETGYVVATLRFTNVSDYDGGQVSSATTVWVNDQSRTVANYRRQGTPIRTTRIEWRNANAPNQAYIADVEVYDFEEVSINVSINANDQYLNQILCLGKGDVQVDEVFIGDTPVSNLQAGICEYHVLTPSQHGGQLGAFQNLFSLDNNRPFHENVITSSAVRNQRFSEPLEIGWFVLSETGKEGSIIEFDIEFAGGLYTQNAQTGALENRTVDLELHVQEVDSDLNPTGTVTIVPKTITANTNNPLRATYRVDMSRSGNWQTLVKRVTGSSNTRQQDDFSWVGLKMYREYSTTLTAYDGCTVMGIRTRATESISGSAATTVSVRARRILQSPVGGGGGATTNPAHIAADIYTNMDYGARRPDTELDMAAFDEARAYWAGDAGFNGVFTGKSTVYEALKTVMQPVLGRPLPIGSQMSIIHDGVQLLRTQMFTEENIKTDTFNLSFTFDEESETDGVEIEYRDPVTFDPKYIRYPETSIFPESVALFGCTDTQQALDYATLYWERKIKQRIMCRFTTELEGRIPRLGDRVGVQHSLPYWGESGLLLSVSGSTLVLDAPVDWSLTNPQIILRRKNGSGMDPVSVTRGTNDQTVIMASPPDFTPDTSTIWTMQYSQYQIRDFVVTKLRPTTREVEVTGLIYDESLYTNAAPFLRVSP